MKENAGSFPVSVLSRCIGTVSEIYSIRDIHHVHCVSYKATLIARMPNFPSHEFVSAGRRVEEGTEERERERVSGGIKT